MRRGASKPEKDTDPLRECEACGGEIFNKENRKYCSRRCAVLGAQLCAKHRKVEAAKMEVEAAAERVRRYEEVLGLALDKVPNLTPRGGRCLRCGEVHMGRGGEVYWCGRVCRLEWVALVALYQLRTDDEKNGAMLATGEPLLRLVG